MPPLPPRQKTKLTIDYALIGNDALPLPGDVSADGNYIVTSIDGTAVTFELVKPAPTKKTGRPPVLGVPRVFRSIGLRQSEWDYLDKSGLTAESVCRQMIAESRP